jgi:hypothetical protein
MRLGKAITQPNLQNPIRQYKGATMSNQNYTATISVDQSPKEAFEAIRNVRGWWSEEIEGNTA